MDDPGKFLQEGVVWYAVFVLSTTLHEAAHAWASLKGGDTTAYRGGQVSLNPIPHIRRSPVGMVVVPVLAFFLSQGRFMIGWASAPYNPMWAFRFPRRAALMALAGPLANLFLVIVAMIAIRVGLATEVFDTPRGSFYPVAANNLWEFPALFLGILFLLNLILLTFNLLPLPPLDGSAVIMVFVGSSRVDLQACKLEYSIVSPK